MKKYLPILFLFIGMFNFNGRANANPFKNTIIVIEKTSSRQSLEELKEGLLKKGVILDFSELVYSKEGVLESIKGEIRFSKNSSGAFFTDNLESILIKKNIAGMEIHVNPGKKKA